jgi:hypothetical protein
VTKYFKAKVDLRQVIEFDVAAETEPSARKKARQIALQKVPNAKGVKIDLALVSERHLNIGSRIKHSQFGPGVIIAVAKTSSSKQGLSFRATVRFESGDTKDLQLPHATVTQEPFGL